MAAISFDFLRDNCNFDTTELAQALDDLCASVGTSLTSVVDGGVGTAAQFGPNSTIQGISVAPDGTVTITAQERAQSFLISNFNSVNFGAGLNITGVGTYTGASITVNFSNPTSRPLNIYGNIYNTNTFRWGEDERIIFETRDITLGAPGPLLNDTAKFFNDPSLNFLDDEFTQITPITLVLAPGATQAVTWRAEIQVTASGGGGADNSFWFENILDFRGIGVTA